MSNQLIHPSNYPSRDSRTSLSPNKAKVCRSTKLIVLGKIKVTSFKDTEVGQAARTAKEVIKGKGERG